MHITILLSKLHFLLGCRGVDIIAISLGNCANNPLHPTDVRGVQLRLDCIFEKKFLTTRNTNRQHRELFIHTDSSTPTKQRAQIVQQELSLRKFNLC